MDTFVLVILVVAFFTIVTTVVVTFYNYCKTKILQSQDVSSNPKQVATTNNIPAKNALCVTGVSAHSLLLVFLAAERGVPVTLIVSSDPSSIVSTFPANIADFVKVNYKCENVYDMIASLPKSVNVIPEDEKSSSLPGIQVGMETIKDPFFMAETLCGKADSVIIIQQSCSKLQDDFDII